MRCVFGFNPNSGVVLILAVWVIGFLTVLALAVGLGARQKIIVLKRLEGRARLRSAVQAGAKKAISVLAEDMENSQFLLTAAAKMRRHNNSAEFSSIALGDDVVQVSHQDEMDVSGRKVEVFGLVDEQSKINLNVVDRGVLSGLFSRVLGILPEDADVLADNVLDWRDFGQRSATGFFSDSYYQNLESPYAMKERPFERMEELLLIKGMDYRKYIQLIDYLTVYGDGRININTAGRIVLLSLGLNDEAVDGIFLARRGLDGIEATEDDHIFMRSFDVASEVRTLARMTDDQSRPIDALNARGWIGINSFVYSFSCRPLFVGGKAREAEVYGVFNGLTSRIEAWRQK